MIWNGIVALAANNLINEVEWEKEYTGAEGEPVPDFLGAYKALASILSRYPQPKQDEAISKTETTTQQEKEGE